MIEWRTVALTWLVTAAMIAVTVTLFAQ